MSRRDFKPAWWLPGRHLQTVWPTLVRRRVELATRRERLELPDGDFLDLNWAGDDSDTSNADSTPVVLVLHGLEGSIESSYVRGLMARVQAHGWRAVLMHFRGCSGEPNRLPRSYHSGETADLAQVIFHIQKCAPGAPIAAVGYSLGGNVLLKWLGEVGANSPLACAVAVSVPYVLSDSADSISKGLSHLYERRLMRSLKRSVLRKGEQLDLGLDLRPRAIARLSTFWEFDEHVTAPLHGFAGARDYYDRSSSRAFLRDIDSPTLLIHARDDPFMSPTVIPRADELSSSTELQVFKSGGHVGFVSGRWPWAAEYWLESRVVEWIAARLAT